RVVEEHPSLGVRSIRFDLEIQPEPLVKPLEMGVVADQQVTGVANGLLDRQRLERYLRSDPGHIAERNPNPAGHRKGASQGHSVPSLTSIIPDESFLSQPSDPLVFQPFPFLELEVFLDLIADFAESLEMGSAVVLDLHGEVF